MHKVCTFALALRVNPVSAEIFEIMIDEGRSAAACLLSLPAKPAGSGIGASAMAAARGAAVQVFRRRPACRRAERGGIPALQREEIRKK